MAVIASASVVDWAEHIYQAAALIGAAALGVLASIKGRKDAHRETELERASRAPAVGITTAISAGLGTPVAELLLQINATLTQILAAIGEFSKSVDDRETKRDATRKQERVDEELKRLRELVESKIAH